MAIGCLLWQQSAEARAQFGRKFILPSISQLGPGKRQFDSWPFIYGTLVTSLVAICAGATDQPGDRRFPGGAVPGLAAPAAGYAGGTAGGDPERGLRIMGHLCFLPVVVPPWEISWKLPGHAPVLNLFFSGPIRVSGASRLAAALILAIMITPTIAAVSRDVFWPSPQPARGLPGAGGTQWETIWQGADPVRSVRYPGSGDPGPGSGAGRDHGGHDGDRQQRRRARFASCARATPCQV